MPSENAEVVLESGRAIKIVRLAGNELVIVDELGSCRRPPPPAFPLSQRGSKELSRLDALAPMKHCDFFTPFPHRGYHVRRIYEGERAGASAYPIPIFWFSIRPNVQSPMAVRPVGVFDLSGRIRGLFENRELCTFQRH